MRRDRFQLIYEVLRAINHGNHLVSHIAHYTYTSYSIIMKYIDLLELHGLVETRRDGRSLLVFLTRKGREALEKMDSILFLVDPEKPILEGRDSGWK